MSRMRVWQCYCLLSLILLATPGIGFSQEQHGQNPPDKSKGNASKNPDEDNVDVMLGISSLITNPGNTNYGIVNNSVLQAKILGSATPQFLTGLSFTLPFDRPCRWRAGDDSPRPWRAFVSLKFTPGSNETTNGYVIGGSYRLGKLLDVLAGFALTPISEVSPGFQRAAIQAVKDNPSLDAYRAFNTDAMARNTLNAFDGFPILRQTGTGPQSTVYAGEALTTHYRGGFIIGIAFPLRLKALLTGESQKTAQQPGGTEKVKSPARN